MEPTLLPEDILVAECCDGASLHDGDLVVMRAAFPEKQAAFGSRGEALIVHRLLGKDRDNVKDGFLLRTRGDNLLLRDDKTWVESEFAGKVTCLLRRTETGYDPVAIHARMNRWHAALARFEERLYLDLRSLKRWLIGSRALPLSGLIVRAVHGLTRKVHMRVNYMTAQSFREKRVCR
ncbi:MAG: S24/S26 family peptidase [Deltaproteobacteria bacterium]|nr:S24/S26 family peptidase [Deltaproteobacteria bacterium]